MKNDDENSDKPANPNQFRKHTSGNPRGRPSGSKNRKTIIKEIANERHKVKIEGKPQRRSTFELVLMALRNKAVAGNARAIKEFERLFKIYQEPNIPKGVGYLVVPEDQSMEEWEAEIEANSHLYEDPPWKKDNHPLYSGEKE